MYRIGYWGLKLLEHVGHAKDFHVFTKNCETLYLQDVIKDEELSEISYKFIIESADPIEDLDEIL